MLSIKDKSMLSIKDLIKNNDVVFLDYRRNNLWYSIDNEDINFIFPVPIDDIGNATFNCRDRAILFMRYIRKYHDSITKEEKEQNDT